MGYMTLVKRYFLTLNERAVVAVSTVRDAHIGASESRFRGAWDLLFGEDWEKMLVESRRLT